MSDEPNIGVTLRLKPDRRQITRGGHRRRTDRLPAVMWMQIADTLTRLRELSATASVQRARAVTLRQRARNLSGELAKIIAMPSTRGSDTR